MKPSRPLLLVWLILLFAQSAHAGEIGIATLVQGSPLVLRGVTWYRLVPGARIADGDIIEVGERGQVQIEFGAGNAVNLVGAGSLYVSPPRTPGAPGPLTLSLPRGWLKAAARSTQVRVRTTGPSLELFVESGAARLTEFLSNGSTATDREIKRGEFWSKQSDKPFALQQRAPKAFVDAMPREFVDPLPNLAGKFATAPLLAADHDVTYPEAEPWLASRDRAVFEKRFTSRLRDPAFRKAVEPHAARYPTWDRKLHPEKYAPRH
jgi:hypothetical protein